MRLRLSLIGNFFRYLRLILVILCFLALGFLFFDELERVWGEEIGSWKNDQTADCAIVLTGGLQRVREGFDLLTNRRVKKLIISGVYKTVQIRDLLPQWDFYGDLRESDVILERKSGTTFGNAQQSLAITEALGCRDVLLVTSRLHMYRAFKTFRAVFPENIAIYKNAVFGSLRINPWWEAGQETAKSLFYRLWVY